MIHPHLQPSTAPLDLLVITAANSAQAEGYRAQLTANPPALAGRTLVVSDPADRRVGSGASTLVVLEEIAREFRASPSRGLAGILASRRILVLHSGGDSRRLPAYAAQGKVFAPLHATDADARPLSLLDLIVQDLAPLVASGSVVIAAGDMFLDLQRHARLLQPHGVLGVAFPAGHDTARGHGVYVLDPKGRVRDFLQKPTLPFARSRGAVDRRGQLLIDSGVLAFSPSAADAMLRAAGPFMARVRGGSAFLDLYEHLAMALAPSLDEREYLQRVAASSGIPHAQLASFRRRMRRIRFDAVTIPQCQFLHFGTTREYLASRSRDLSNCAGVAHSAHTTRNTAVLDACAPSVRVRAGHGSLVCNVPATLEVPCSLPRGFGACFLPIDARDWTVLLFSVNDDFKSPVPLTRSRGTPTSIAESIASHPEYVHNLVPGAPVPDPSLWHAPLWIIGTPTAAWRHAKALIARTTLSPEWIASPRFSCASLMPRVNQARLAAHRAECLASNRLTRLSQLLTEYPLLGARSILSDLAMHSDFAERTARTLTPGRANSPSHQARLFRIGAMLREAFPAASARAGLPPVRVLNDLAFESVARTVQQHEAPAPRPTHAGIQHDQIIWATCPARIDLAGGWTDTPPIGVDLGGLVLNAAITLNDQYPIQVVCRLKNEPGVRLSSIDLGRSIHFASAESLRGFSNPHEWSALPKAALFASGLVPSGSTPIARWLRALAPDRRDVGIDLTVFSALPKGSGLGGSSILGAAILSALAKLTARPISHDALIRRTSLLEQLMSTGGGWQDQAGAVLPGVKLLETSPGATQSPTCTPLDVSGSLAGPEGRARLLLYYTGQRRLARNILRNVVSRYLERDQQALDVIRRLKQGARNMKSALDEHDLDGFARQLMDYWALKCTLDSGATNPEIEAIIARVRPFLSAWCLPGAGGGGFILMFARDEAAAAKAKRALLAAAPNALARFYDFAIDTRGLAVTSL